MNVSSLTKLAIVMAAGLYLTACSQENQLEDNTEAPPVFVKMAEVQQHAAEQTFEFPAEVSAVKTVDVRFEVTGRLIEENLRAGNEVSKGEVLARLDPEPFERRVREQQTRLNQEERELKRVEKLVNQGLLPQSGLDSAKTAFELAEIALSNAKQDLDYSIVKAPFDGQVVRRLVDNDSYVRAGEVIASLQDRSLVYFNIHVPERLFTQYAGRKDASVQAQILARPDDWFDIEYVEHAAQPDAVTQTYKIVFSVPADTGITVAPGARAKVRVNIDQNDMPQYTVVPFTALHAEGDRFSVWRFNAQQGNVEKVAVTVDKLDSGYAAVSGDLQPGDKVVSAGVSKMREGLKVKQYKPE